MQRIPTPDYISQVGPTSVLVMTFSRLTTQADFNPVLSCRSLDACPPMSYGSWGDVSNCSVPFTVYCGDVSASADFTYDYNRTAYNDYPCENRTPLGACTLFRYNFWGVMVVSFL